MSTKAFTLRLPSVLYREVAQRKEKSMTQFVLEAIEEKVERERQSELRAGFATLADGANEDETWPWQELQQEAMNRVDG